MSHEIEFKDGRYCFAYAGEEPWHKLGKKVPSDLAPNQMLEAAGLDWEVSKIPGYADINGKRIRLDHELLVRNDTGQILDEVTADWKQVQNSEAAQFFNQFIEEGSMKMETAGSLKGGQIVFFLAKVDDSFELFNGDKVDSYLLFSNIHRYGQSTSVQFNPIRVVCNNTFTLAMSEKVKNIVKITHRKQFDHSEVKTLLGIAKSKMGNYKETASFLGNKKAAKEDIVEYFQRIFPVQKDSEKKFSKNASAALNVMETQPGANFAEGSWWQTFNTVTFMADHCMGRSENTRLESSWYGKNRQIKLDAMKLAVEYAEKSPALIAA